MTTHLLYHNQLLTLRPLYSKGRATPRTKEYMALFHHLLDILRVEIAATNENEIFEPTCDKKLLLDAKTEISSA
jgi:hypothetical protein